MPQLEQVLEQYPEDVKIVVKNFPLRNHKFARAAAAATLAAKKQGKYWELHDALFDNVSSLTDEKIIELAKKEGLNIKKLEADMAGREIQQQIQKDLSAGQAAGVRGTPTVFINGRLLQNRSLAGYKQLIDKALKESGRKK